MYKHLSRLFLGASAVCLALQSQAADAKDLKLLVPIGNVDKVSSTGFQAFFDYFNGGLWPWVLSVAVGIAVLNGVIGGMMVMMSGGDSGMYGEGINKLKYTTLGLIIIALAGTILRTINPDFYN